MKKYKIWLMRLIPIAIILILTVGLSEIFYQSMVDSTTENCWKELYMARNDTVDEISTALNTNIKILDLAADAIVLNTDFEDDVAIRQYLESVQEECIFDRIDVIFPDDSILVTSTGQWLENKEMGNYEELVSQGTHMSLRSVDFLTGRQAIHAFSPVYNASGTPIAILGATVYCSTLGEIFSSVHYGSDAQLFIVDRRDGNLVLDKLHENPGNIEDMQDYETPEEGRDFISEILKGETGKMAYTSEDYGITYTIFAPIEDTYFTLTMVIREEVVLEDVNELQKTMIWAGFIEVLLLLLMAIWIYFIMRRSMENEKRAQLAELALLHEKEQELENQYAVVINRREFLETMAVNLPGGYHRCTTDHNFTLTFISNSFTQITGYTMEQLQNELNGSYLGIVSEEDRDYFISLAPQLERDGYIHCFYRMRRRDGILRWVKDTTQYVERDGEKYYQCALMDISEQIDEIERAKQEAEESSHAKSTFLFNISHDIRTPINAILGFSHIIEENAEDPKLVRATVAKLNQAGNSLMMLMNDVLDISRIERGKEELTLRPMNLYEHGKNLYEMFASDMKAKGINFIAEGEHLHDNVYGDHLKMTRIMMNMLSNAKKFTPAGGSVSFGGVRLHRDEKSCTYRFFVKDTGIGMSEEFQKRAFEQFERERTSTESGVPGSGLGLAIIKMLVDLMDGKVEIQSELGKGTEISVTLTLQLADDEQTPQVSGEENSFDVVGKRVLLVEDNDFNREIAKYILEGMHLLVEEAENGAICIKKLVSADPDYYDLILMDIQMPVMDGYTTTTAIRNLADKKIAGIPIVAMTANAFDEDKRKSLEIGMNGHIGKPIDINDLRGVLLDVLKKRSGQL